MLTEKDYCDYYTCVALKEKGFPQHITEEAYIIDNYGEDEYDIGERLPIPLIPDYMDDIAAPTIYEAQKWLREAHNLHIEITYSPSCWTCKIYDLKEWDYIKGFTFIKSYEEALSEGIKEAVKILKEK